MLYRTMNILCHIDNLMNKIIFSHHSKKSRFSLILQAANVDNLMIDRGDRPRGAGLLQIFKMVTADW